MKKDADLEKLISEVLRKIGRNIILFQQMEQLLKHLVSIGKCSGYSSELKSILQQRIKTINKQTMGKVVGQFVENTFMMPEENNNELENLKEPWISFNLSIGRDGELYNQRKLELGLVVDERNNLVHHLLPKWDMESLESSKEIELYLDQQREKIIPELEYLSAIIKSIDDYAKFMASEDGQRLFHREWLRNSQLVQWFFDFAVKKARFDGWVVFDNAKHFIRQQVPQEFTNLENGYSHKTLKENLLAAELFDISEEPTKNGGVRVLYRIKPDLNYTSEVI